MVATSIKKSIGVDKASEAASKTTSETAKKTNAVKSKKGSMFVEAAIVLPIFFLAILSLALLIRLAGVEENTMRCFSHAGQVHAKEMYLGNLGPLQDMVLEGRVLENLEAEEGLTLENVRLKRHYSDFESFADPGIINVSLLYEVKLALPLAFKRKLEFQEHLVFRGFIGRVGDREGFGFDAMERTDDPNAVYVFPRAGERYHKPDCRVIEVYPVEKILSPALKKKYSPCKLCGAKDLPYGCKVYCFERSGHVFHKGSCPTVDRYVVEMDKEEAIEKGYTPCAFCGGS